MLHWAALFANLSLRYFSKMMEGPWSTFTALWVMICYQLQNKSWLEGRVGYPVSNLNHYNAIEKIVSLWFHPQFWPQKKTQTRCYTFLCGSTNRCAIWHILPWCHKNWVHRSKISLSADASKIVRFVWEGHSPTMTHFAKSLGPNFFAFFMVQNFRYWSPIHRNRHLSVS